jgi:poly(3-hydroxybutyrate) depolymerase
VASSLALAGQVERSAVHIEPDTRDNFSKAVFYFHVPEKVTAPNYVLVLLPGINADGSGLLTHKEWRQFAEETQAAMVACTFVKKDKRKYDAHNNYSAAQCGSGAALESAIEKFDKTQTTSLADLPLLIYGHSGGGQFAFGFSCHNPKRMIGFAAGKGGYYYPDAIEGTFTVPGLMISGQKDLPRRKNAIRELYRLSRAEGAPWCWMEDKHGHGAANNLSVVIPYFRELLRLQLAGESGRSPDRSKLVGVSVDLENRQVLSGSAAFTTSDTSPKQGWLPSELVFDAWKKEDIGAAKYAEQKKSADRQ